MIAKNVTLVVFGTAVALTLVSVGLVLIGGRGWLLLIGISVLFNIWGMAKSDRSGLVQSTQIRRAYEPARHFSAAQVVVLLGCLLLQLTVSAFVVVSR